MPHILITDYCEDIGPEFSELMERFREQAGRLIDLLDLSVPAVVRLKRLLNSLPVHALPDICAAVIKASHSERLEILDAVDLTERFEKTLPLLIRQIEVSKVDSKDPLCVFMIDHWSLHRLHFISGPAGKSRKSKRLIQHCFQNFAIGKNFAHHQKSEVGLRRWRLRGG